MIIVNRSHPGIIHVAQSVPDAVFLVHPHVAHLNGKEVLDGRLPDIPFKNIIGNSERLRLFIAVLNIIQSLTCYFRKIKFQILVSQEGPPVFGFGLTQGSGSSVFLNSHQYGCSESNFILVYLDNRHLILTGAITYLGNMDHG